MPAVEKSRAPDIANPIIPRPPNSWILYRSDMVACLPPPPPGTTRSQADVSKIISAMWKSEKPEVKAEYERRAEVKKLEHAAMYPNYRYAPMSKEAKEELKKAKEDKKRKKKQRDATVIVPEGSRARMGRDLPFTSHSYPFHPLDSSQHVHSGPSPPMSAAASPSPEPPQLQLPQLIGAQNQSTYQQIVQPQATRSYYRPHTATSRNVNQYPVQPSTYLAPPQPSVPSHYQATPADSPVASSSLYTPEQQFVLPQVTQPEQNENQQYALTQDTPLASTTQENEDHLSFGLQQFAGDTLGQWANQNPEFHPTLDQFLNNTSPDCYQLQINPHAQGNLDQSPVGPFEVEVGQVDFDFLQLQWDSVPAMGTFQAVHNNVASNNGGGYENMAGPASHASPSEGSDQASASVDQDQGFQLEQYINFNPTFDYIAPSPLEEEIAQAPIHTPYIPPAGAAHVGKRRVAGCWNASFVMQDPIDV
ncbi:hypothetical protein H0H87_001426 [Tephrocybe sp. NHM501043]|nr:hypothetical protein H0H87_001426 [Tephrocybe sp. NHM501043]